LKNSTKLKILELFKDISFGMKCACMWSTVQSCKHFCLWSLSWQSCLEFLSVG